MLGAISSFEFNITLLATAQNGHVHPVASAKSSPSPLEQLLTRNTRAESRQSDDALEATTASGSDLPASTSNEVPQPDTLILQPWLLFGFVIIAILVALWLFFALRSRHKAAHLSTTVKQNTTTVRRDGKGTQRTNALITIRNAATQQPEVVEQVTTRRLFRVRPKAPNTTPPKPAEQVTPAQSPPTQ